MKGHAIFALSMVVVFGSALGKPSNAAEDTASGNLLESKLSREYPHGKSDLVFLLDRSGSIGDDDFRIQLSFVEGLLSEFSIGPDATRVAVVSYSEDVTRHIDYISGESGNKCSFLSALKEVKFVDGGSTNIASALQEAKDIFFNSRPLINDVLILLSDGIANEGGSPLPVARELRKEGVEIFTIGVGLFDRPQLQQIASSVKHFFAFYSFREFWQLARRIRGDPHETNFEESVNQTLCDDLCHKPFGDEYSCCDLQAKCACSLVGGRHQCICGPGTYGQNGFLYECKLCPRGMYKSTYEPADQCTPCPPDSTTADKGSQTLGACYCKEGYRGEPSQGIPCQQITCPSLQPPKNGRISPAHCENYQSVCSFHCDVGFELVDPASAKRRCKADGDWTETTAQCQKVQCHDLASPTNGDYHCRNQEVGFRSSYNTTCSFTCSEGYNPVGSRERTCTDTGNWSGHEFRCRAITCPVLPPLSAGSLEPPECATTRQRVKLLCTFHCDQGYRVRGPSFKQCLTTGTWSSNETVECVDNIPPEIRCPPSVAKETDPGLPSSLVSWALPTATDNMDGTDSLTVTVDPVGMKPPHRFAIGSTVITYGVTDTTGLSGLCRFKVVVKDTQPPVVESCPDGVIDFSSRDIKFAATWEEPTFSDNSKEELTMFQSHTQGVSLPWGTHIVTYTATDAARLTAECRFSIRIGRFECPNHPDPRNGARACDRWLLGQFCRVYCNEAYEFAETPAAWYYCSGGQWSTNPPGLPTSWPDCSSGVRLAMETQYYSGDCINDKTKGSIKSAFVEDFKESLFGMNGGCLKENACTVEFVTVYCGEIDTDEPTRRKRRDVIGGDAEHKFTNTAVIDFTVSIRVPSTETSMQTALLAEAEQTLAEITHEYGTLSNGGQLRLIVGNETMDIVRGSFHVNESRPICSNGSMQLQHECINCAVGLYLDTASQECKPCDVGTYQDEEGQEDCKQCPYATSTTGTQTKDVNECRRQCNPGTFSPSGLSTCTPCPIGTYQAEFQRSGCVRCRRGTTTPTKGSRSYRDCQAVCREGEFSINGVHPCQPCPRGSYQPNQQQSHCIECPGSETTTARGAQTLEECTDIDSCQSAPCLNSATCVNEGGDFHCECTTGFTGTLCEEETDECLSRPCFFGGLCRDLVGGFLCRCSRGYEGARCEIETNECLSSPCRNDAGCQDQIAGFECDCVDGFSGALCEVPPPDECLSEACFHGATCVVTPGSFVCVCPVGFDGARCQSDVDECESQPCQNDGSCRNLPGSFRCACASGFEGVQCELDTNECLGHACATGSTCRDVVDGYQCLCPPGITGMYCETVMSQDYLLSFASPVTSHFSKVPINRPEINAVTVAMWIRTSDTANMGTPISYAAKAPTNSSVGAFTVIDNALTMVDCASLTIYLNGQAVYTDVAINTGRWNSVIFTWTILDGEWLLYLNGAEVASGAGLSADTAIPGEGEFVLGQEQDTLGGSFSSRETYLGDIYKLNVWDRALVDKELRDVSRHCSDRRGNLVAWADFLARTEERGPVSKAANGSDEMPECGLK